MSKTILVISPDLPYPPNQGNKRDIWGHINFFHSAGWRVVLIVCGWTTESDLKTFNNQVPLDITCHAVQREVDSWALKEHSQTISILQNLIDLYRPQVVWCEYAHFSSLVAALNVNGAKLWFRPHNFELPHLIDKTLTSRPWLTWQSYSFPKRAFSCSIGLCFNLVQRFYKEQLMYRIADRLFFISYSDLRFMSKLYKGSVSKDWVLPFVDCETIPIKEDKTPLDIIYVGIHAKGNEPTIRGSHKLINEIIPAVEATMPGAFRFHIVGWGSYEMYGKYASKTILIHDYVENLQAFMQDMDIACLPIEIGWGCKIKMVEALASGLPVVGSYQTFRGVEPLQEAYYVCRTIQDYVEALKLLQDSDIRRHTALAGKAAYKTWLDEGHRILYAALEELETRASTSSGESEVGIGITTICKK
ncbi:MAG: glycosyltransferase family 4 protein [Nostoc sp. LLA-1]|nr:glycosyltransferase family 4 protein [Cyanocohniella sp. LLY]